MGHQTARYNPAIHKLIFKRHQSKSVSRDIPRMGKMIVLMYKMNKDDVLSYCEGEQINVQRSYSVPLNATVVSIQDVRNDAKEITAREMTWEYEDGTQDSHRFDFDSSHPWATELRRGWIANNEFDESDADPADLGLNGGSSKT